MDQRDSSENAPGQPVKLARRPPLQFIPDITKEVLDSFTERELGFRSRKTVTVAQSLKARAEDELVRKEYKEMKCGIPGLTKSTFLMVFSPDGTKMASTHGNHNVYVTDLRTGKNIKTLVGHPRTPWCVAFHPSSNQILASGCLGGQVRIWDLSGGSEVWTAESQTVISSLAFHPVDRLLVIATYNELYFWDWSQPKPFMQTCTSNAKEKVRYVAFDRLGHKLITGIANTPQGFTRWERVRAPVPVNRHTDRITAYRRRITPRLVPPSNINYVYNPPTQPVASTPQTPPTPPEQSNFNSIPERERRIAVCYRNLVEQYEMLVQRYLELYRPASTMDRGTDPMEAEHLASTSSSNTSNNSNNNTNSNVSASTSSNTSSTSTVTQTNARTNTLPISMPGPSGISRQNTRPTKRPNTNIHSTKSDSSTVYQSDSSSSSDSDESPLPKRRISLVPNSNLFRKESPKVTESNTSTPNPNEKIDKRKKLFLNRSSNFHLTRSSSSQNIPNRNDIRIDRNSERHSPTSQGFRFLQMQRPSRTLHLEPFNSESNRRTITTDDRLNLSPEAIRGNRTPRNSEPHPSDRPGDLRIFNETELSRLRGRLRGLSEGSLSSADEVINFSERTNLEETGEPTNPENPNEFSIDAIYRNILTDLETIRNTSRNADSNHTNTETSNILQSFSQRLESIMNQSDAILTNLRQSMDILMEPIQNAQNNTTSSTTSNTTPNDIRGRGFSPRRGYSDIHTRNRSTGTFLRGNNANSVTPRLNTPRSIRFRSLRMARSQNYDNIRRSFPFIDPALLDREDEPIDAPANEREVTELINNLFNARDPLEVPENETETPNVPVRSSTPVPFPSDHNYPITDSPQEQAPSERIDPNSNPIADHTYPRDPQATNRSDTDYLTPLVSSLQSTINHISMQTNLLRRQVETIEIIDRARFEVFQLQEMRKMWEDIRRHIIFFNSSDRRMNNSNMSNVRQMMAWARISDPSPSSESAQSSTEQSTPEPSASTDIPSTSRSSASSSNESRSNMPQNPQTYMMSRFRQNHIKKRAQNRLYWRRRTMRNETPNFAPRRFNRSFNQYSSRHQNRNDGREFNLSEVNVSLMITGLMNLLMQNSRLVVRTPLSPDRNNIERRVLSERIIQNRLRNARQRLNQINGFESSSSTNFLEDPAEFTTSNRNDSIRYEARLKLSVYIESFTRFLENRSSPIPQSLCDQIKILTELTILLTDLLLLQIMETIPRSSGSFLDPERVTLAHRIDQLCAIMIQNPSRAISASSTRILQSLRLTVKYIINSVRLVAALRERRTRYLNEINRQEAMLNLNQQLRRLYQFCSYLDEPELTQNSTTNDPGPSTSTQPPTTNQNDTNQNSGLSHVYRLGEVLDRLRNVRGRLEQMSQHSFGRVEQLTTSQQQQQNNSQTVNNSSTEHDPARSTDDSPSDRESESFEGFQSDITGVYRDRFTEPGALYRTSHVNLFPPPEQSSSQSSPERIPNPLSPRERPWNVPTVQVNDVPISNNETTNQPQAWHPRIWSSRYALSEHPAALRPLSAATGLFRPRFLIPLYAGVNPFDADLDENQREPSGTYDGVMTATVSPNHRIQMWDISKCHIPNISNHEKNIVVSECKIHNDGSVDISRDGTLLVTLLPSGGYLNVTNRLGIYSIKWDTLGQCLYTTSFEQNAISVSLSPISRHLIVGLASRRVTLLPSDRWTMARIFLLDDRKIKISGRGQLVVVRDLEQGRDRDLNFMSVNCIKWIPVSGQGIVYATNTGQLKVLT